MSAGFNLSQSVSHYLREKEGPGANFGGQFIEGSYGIPDNFRYSGPFRANTLLQSASGASVNTSSTSAGSVSQASASSSASSWPGAHPE
jgi:hypothetical protein